MGGQDVYDLSSFEDKGLIFSIDRSIAHRTKTRAISHVQHFGGQKKISKKNSSRYSRDER